MFSFYGGSMKKFQKRGFTLAEVLIVIGIIGVVSAMTIPALINKCQKIVLANQAKKEYAMWTQVFKNILADNNTTSLSETELFGKIEGAGYNAYVDCISNPTTTNVEFWTELGKYVKISPSANKGEEYYTSETREYNANSYPINLSNGSMLRGYIFSKTPETRSETKCLQIKELGGSMCNAIGYIDIDVNGNKGPNIDGRDIFRFYLSDEGILYPYGGKDYALAVANSPNIEYDSIDELNINSSRYYWKNIDTSKAGILATGRLVEEGWKMNY
jgi:prepilin-type N-terminal cleavage/methylation domain-containing protein